MDGFYTDNLPSLVASTITVSHFSGDASTCPRNEKTEHWSVTLGSGGSVHVSMCSELQRRNEVPTFQIRNLMPTVFFKSKTYDKRIF